MKYVCIIMMGCVGDEHPYKVFSSEKKAEAELENLKKDKYWKTTEPYIEKWEVM